MVEKVERFKAHDGREFLSREAGLRHEAIEGMIAAIPELALIRPKLEAHLNAISVWCEPLASHLAKTTLEVGAKTTLDLDEQAGTCDCLALMNGDSDHAASCPSFDPASLPPERYGTPDLRVYTHEDPVGRAISRG